MALEEHDQPLHKGLPSVDGRSKGEIACHLELLWEADLVWSRRKEAEKNRAGANLDTRRGLASSMAAMKNFDAYRLTTAGHKFLTAARDETLWNRAKKKACETTGVLTFEVLKTVLLGKVEKLF
jgi:hypothetical protein